VGSRGTKLNQGKVKKGAKVVGNEGGVLTQIKRGEPSGMCTEGITPGAKGKEKRRARGTCKVNPKA